MSDLELLKRYLQNEIDNGSHKIFVFDKDYNAIEFKVIEALNEINNLQNQLQQKENIIKEIKSQLDYLETYSSKEDVFEDMKRRLNNIEKIIGDSNNEWRSKSFKRNTW